MLGKFVRTLLVSGPLALFACAATAAPVTFSFSGGNTTAGSLFFSQAGLNLTVTGNTYSAPDFIEENVQINRGNNGLGVCGSLLVGATGNCDLPLLDGGTSAGDDNELLKFAFSSGVLIQSISFANNDRFEDFDFFLGGALAFASTSNVPSQGENVFTFATPYPAGLVFGIGLRENSDEVRIAGLTVLFDAAVVPLPPAGLLLLGALGAMAALRRRKDSRGIVAG